MNFQQDRLNPNNVFYFVKARYDEIPNKYSWNQGFKHVCMNSPNNNLLEFMVHFLTPIISNSQFIREADVYLTHYFNLLFTGNELTFIQLQRPFYFDRRLFQMKLKKD